MAKSIWNKEDRDALLKRFASLRGDEKPRWGKMTVAQMVKHCSLPLMAAMGELKVAPKSTPFQYWPMRKLIIYWAPWPKNAPTAPEFVVTDQGDLAENLACLQSSLERFAAGGPGQSLLPHAAFGAMSGKDWGALTYRHIDFHLTQFGA